MRRIIDCSLRQVHSGRTNLPKLFAVVRVDTHGNRFVVKDKLTLEESKSLERHYDAMTHHQGYYVIPQAQLSLELNQSLNSI
jgi:hypothetical protein